jgi:hypothetical protein
MCMKFAVAKYSQQWYVSAVEIYYSFILERAAVPTVKSTHAQYLYKTVIISLQFILYVKVVGLKHNW